MDNICDQSNQFYTQYEHIRQWLRLMRIKHYTINKKTLVVDVDSDVYLDYRELSHIPVKFGKVSGWFSISDNGNLVSLVGSPDECRAIICYRTGIKNFIGAGNNTVVWAGDNKNLLSFEGLPTKMKDLDIFRSCRNIKSLDHFPKSIELLRVGTKFKYFHNLYQHVDNLNNIICNLDGDIKDCDSILPLLYVSGLTEVKIISFPEITDIISSELQATRDTGSPRILRFANRLIDAGYQNLAEIP